MLFNLFIPAGQDLTYLANLCYLTNLTYLTYLTNLTYLTYLTYLTLKRKPPCRILSWPECRRVA